MNSPIRTATTDDAPAISSLVQSSFQAHVADDWEQEAQDSFFSETTPEKIAALLASAAFAAVYEEEGNFIGVIVLPRPNLVQLCFVATTHLRRGVGSALWRAARSYLEEKLPEVKTVELNASPYAVAAYAAMGFFPISKQYRRRGWVATRMACWLPNQGLESEANAA